MTGFGSAGGGADGVDYNVEVRSVNNRYFKINVKLPEAWSSAEAEIEKLVRGRLTRGSVSLSVRMKVSQEMAAGHVNAEVLRRYVDQLRELEVEANPTLRIDLGSMLLLPGVCEPPAMDQIVARTRGRLMEVVAEALNGLMTMREQEGQALKDDLAKNCRLIEDRLADVKARAPMVVQEYHDRLAIRVKQLTEQARIEIDQDSLAREVALFAERSDIAEEITRLTGHVAQFRRTMDSPEPAGRKLDFIAQEMLREANTIASKSNDSDIARAVVDIKTAIDRIKEQVQNAE